MPISRCFTALRPEDSTSKSSATGSGSRRISYSPLENRILETPGEAAEHGALMAANVLNSPRAIEMSIFVVRAFVRLRATLATHKDLARKLDELEKRTAQLASKHDALAADTKSQLEQVIAALRQLMSVPQPHRRPIGFVTPKT